MQGPKSTRRNWPPCGLPRGLPTTLVLGSAEKLCTDNFVASLSFLLLFIQTPSPRPFSYGASVCYDLS
jgi:hypothetical protein